MIRTPKDFGWIRVVADGFDAHRTRLGTRTIMWPKNASDEAVYAYLLERDRPAGDELDDRLKSGTDLHHSTKTSLTPIGYAEGEWSTQANIHPHPSCVCIGAETKTNEDRVRTRGYDSTRGLCERCNAGNGSQAGVTKAYGRGAIAARSLCLGLDAARWQIQLC